DSIKTRFEALTGARWLFASMVFVYHNRKYWRDKIPGELLRFINEWHMGVSLFFILSGFLIAYQYNRAQKRPYPSYLLLRFARIMPVYWLILIISYIDWGWPKSIWETIRCITLTHGYFDRYNLDGLAQAWSLNVELTFYLFAPVIFFFWNKKWWQALLLLLAMFAAVWLIGSGLNYWNSNPGRLFSPLHFLIHSTFWGRSVEFLSGIYLASVMQGRMKNHFIQFQNCTLWGGLGLILSMYLIGWFQPDIFHHGNDHWLGWLIQTIFVPGFSLIWFYGLMTEHTWMQKWFSTKWMVLLGNASFTFYLVHISYVNLKFKKWFLFPDRNYVVLWLLSIFIYLLFEKPINDWVRKLVKQREPKSKSIDTSAPLQTY
ncbi:MAG: hypothetical protein RLY16_2378, partial [Bacteroidota bacterium]